MGFFFCLRQFFNSKSGVPYNTIPWSATSSMAFTISSVFFMLLSQGFMVWSVLWKRFLKRFLDIYQDTCRKWKGRGVSKKHT